MRYLIPFSFFIVIVLFLGLGLSRDPTEIPSPLIGKPVPDFNLPAVNKPNLRVSLAELKGRVTLLNVWASWCVACRSEHPLLMKLARETSIPIYGLNYKDQPEDARRWLVAFGNPYARSASDLDGKVGFNLGVYGVPETFLIDANGTVVYKHIGPLTETTWQEKLLPLLVRLTPNTTPDSG